MGLHIMSIHESCRKDPEWAKACAGGCHWKMEVNAEMERLERESASMEKALSKAPCPECGGRGDYMWVRKKPVETDHPTGGYDLVERPDSPMKNCKACGGAGDALTAYERRSIGKDIQDVNE